MAGRDARPTSACAGKGDAMLAWWRGTVFRGDRRSVKCLRGQRWRAVVLVAMSFALSHPEICEALARAKVKKREDGLATTLPRGGQ